MARSASQYHCQSCGAVSPKWTGKCDACGDWNTLVEERIEQIPGQTKRKISKTVELKLLSAANAEGAYKRHRTNIEEFDRVTGGGLVPGSAVLIGGDPGIGKSTLLLQLVCELGMAGKKTAYITGEESVEQVRMRALRLGLQNAEAGLAAATNAADIAETVRNTPDLDLLVIDSIQTMFVPGLDSAPGTVSQVRASAHELIRATKSSRATVIFVGHVTKDGAIAGPRVLEHMVDCVLYFEGDRSHHFRILRGVKNRFGATDEIGVFEMSETGLQQVPNPSELFLGDRQNRVAGTAVFAGLEGTRPLLVEIEALVAPSTLATPRRNVVGWDTGRLAMLTAVLEARCGVPLSGRDIFLNVAGGLRIQEPAADLAVAAALISSVTVKPLPARTVFFGEIALSAELRQVAQAETRLKEAAKLGFEQAMLPRLRNKMKPPQGISVCLPANLSEFIDSLGGIT